MKETNHFFDTIYKLRKEEEVLLFGKISEISASEELYINDFLEEEFLSESKNYPFEQINYDGAAALWASKIVYFAAQFLLYREVDVEIMKNNLPIYERQINPAAILSADLLLRFLPQIYKKAKAIHPEDELISMLSEILDQWNYSNIELNEYKEAQNLDTIFSSKRLQQLYIDRVIQYKAKNLLQDKVVKQFVMANLGDYSEIYWKDIEH